MADNAFILEQPLHVAGGEASDLLEVEPGEGRAEVLALDEDGAPAQPGLKSFEAEFLKKPAIIGHGKSPLRIVVGQELGHVAAPAAAWFSVGTGNGRAHEC